MKRRYSHSPEEAASYVFKKGHWTTEEDEIIRTEVLMGNCKWSDISKKLETHRTGKQCRERWANHLNPDLKKSPWTAEEDEALIAAQRVMGNSWTKIAKSLVGRSENEVKNRWYSALTKRPKASPRPAGHQRHMARAAAYLSSSSASQPFALASALTTEESLERLTDARPYPSPPSDYDLFLLRGDSESSAGEGGAYGSLHASLGDGVGLSAAEQQHWTRDAGRLEDEDFEELSRSIDALFEDNVLGALQEGPEADAYMEIADSYLSCLSHCHPHSHLASSLQFMALRQEMILKGSGGMMAGAGVHPSYNHQNNSSKGYMAAGTVLSSLPPYSRKMKFHVDVMLGLTNTYMPIKDPKFNPQANPPSYPLHLSHTSPPSRLDDLSMASFLVEARDRGFAADGVDSIQSSLSSSPLPSMAQLAQLVGEYEELGRDEGVMTSGSISPTWLEEMRRMLSSAPPSAPASPK
eukprot:gene27686-33435_t